MRPADNSKRSVVSERLMMSGGLDFADGTGRHFECQTGWLFSPIEVINDVKKGERCSFGSFWAWVHQEYELIRTERKVVNPNGKPHRNTIVIRFNDLVKDPASVMKALAAIGLTQQRHDDGKWPKVLDQHVKFVKKPSAQFKARQKLLELEQHSPDNIFPLDPFLNFMGRMKIYFTDLYCHFDWDGDQIPADNPHGLGIARRSTFSYYIWPQVFVVKAFDV